jgi:tetratricopeptide (TPR) repeat protein
MSPPSRPLDKDGFPIPATFDDLPARQEASRQEPTRQEPTRQEAPARRSGPVKFVRWALVLCGVALLTGVVVKSMGRKSIASYYANRAQQQYMADELSEAVASIDQALGWLPDAPELYYQRALYRQQANDLEGSLADYNKLIQMAPSFARAYVGRSVVYQRTNRHREAIEDLSKAIQLRPRNDHALLNHRAYTRAIAGIELDEALEDIKRALEIAGQEDAAYLDTRGYVYFRMGRYDEALADLDRAVRLAAEYAEQMLEAARRERLSALELQWRERQFRENEAVIIYHRGEVHDKLGNVEQAQADLARGKELGYNPAEGVY